MGRLIVNNSLAEVKTVFLVANIVYCILISTKYESTTSTEKHAPNKPEVPLWRDTTSLRHNLSTFGNWPHWLQYVGPGVSLSAQGL